MARPIGWLCICIGIAGLAGCAGKVPLAAPPPAVAMPAGWGAGESPHGESPHGESPHGETAHREPRPAQALDPDWWNRFGSAELARLVREGQGSNLELAAALSRVRQAEAQARIAGVSLLPTVDFGSGFDRALPIGNGSSSVSASAQLQVAYEVDFWGKNKAGVAAAAAALDANREDRQTVALTVTSAIVSTYLEVLSLHDRLEAARAHVANAEHVLVLVKAQRSAGAASPLDLARQRSVVAGQKAAIPELQQQAREAQSALAILLGRAPQSFRIADQGLETIDLPDVTPGLPSDLLARRPDIRRAEANLLAADANVAVARAALFPNIRLTGALGAQSSALLSLLNAPNLLANVSASLMTPIFDAGRLKTERDLAIARKQELVQVYRAAVFNALSEVGIVLGQIRSLDEQRKLKTVELEETRLAFDLSEIRYKVGAEDLMTVLDTQRALADVQNELGILKLKRLQATVSLFKALGGGWQADAPPDRAPSRAPSA